TYETIRLLLETDPRQPRLLNRKVDRDLSIICIKCLEKDPTRRYASALALAEDLERWLKHEPIRARRTGVLIRAKKMDAAKAGYWCARGAISRPRSRFRRIDLEE